MLEYLYLTLMAKIATANAVTLKVRIKLN